jgi:4-aminobutyrate aminotransferase-like enzyme
VALKVLEVIQREKLADNARNVGNQLKSGLQALAKEYPTIVQTVRGLGLMLGMELVPNIATLTGDTSKTQAVRFANLLHAKNLLAIPAGANILRFLPPLNLRPSEAEEGLGIIRSIVSSLAS